MAKAVGLHNSTLRTSQCKVAAVDFWQHVENWQRVRRKNGTFYVNGAGAHDGKGPPAFPPLPNRPDVYPPTRCLSTDQSVRLVIFAAPP